MARKLAVSLLKENTQVNEVLVKLAYSIGVAEPVMANAILDGQEVMISDRENLTPQGIIEYLNLKKPQFAKTAEWGHMGNGFSWDN